MINLLINSFPISKTRKGWRPNAFKSDPSHYIRVHNWIKKNKVLPKTCEWCGAKEKLQYANLSFEYKFDISDWACLCIRCHVRYDTGNEMGRMRFVDINLLEFFLSNIDFYRNYSPRAKTTRKDINRSFLMASDYYKERMTYRAIGEKYGVTTERVRQIIYWYMNRFVKYNHPWEEDKRLFSKEIIQNVSNEYNLPHDYVAELRKIAYAPTIRKERARLKNLLIARKKQLNKLKNLLEKEKSRNLPRKRRIKNYETLIEEKNQNFDKLNKIYKFSKSINREIFIKITTLYKKRDYLKRNRLKI